MKILRSATAAIAFVSTLGSAQTLQPNGRAPGPYAVTLLKLDSNRAGLVDAILENAVERALVAREQIGPGTDATTRAVMQAAMHAIREDADRQLAAVLTPEELATWKDSM
jgi:hypothetical protein